MDGRQITGTDFPNDISRAGPAPIESPPRPMTGFMHPGDVVSDLRFTQGEKREVLAAWASDIRAVPDAPSLRQLDNGAVVRVGDILRALQSLDGGDELDHAMFASFRPFAALRLRFPTRLKSALRWRWPDDDDPPPCPATIAGPLGGPLCSGEAADPGLAPAA